MRHYPDCTLVRTVIGRRAALKSPDGEVLRYWVWNTEQHHHLKEIVGEADRAQAREVMVSRHATAGAMYSDEEAMETLRSVLRLRKDQVEM